MQLTDTHCHLNLNNYEGDLQAVLDRAQTAGVERILVPGIDLDTSRQAVELAEQYPMLFAAVGIHPSGAAEWNDDSTDQLSRLAAHPKTVAIGEIGLDYYRDRAPREVQRVVFSAQLELAAELGLPVVVHNREAFMEIRTILANWIDGMKPPVQSLASRPGVMHSFDGTLEEAREMVELGFLVGISGPVTFKNALEKHRVAAGLPVEALLVETDAPYLTPHPHRGERNEPAYTALIAHRLAELRGMGDEEIAGITAENAARLFVWES